MSRGLSGGKKVKKIANARNHNPVCLFKTTENEEIFIFKTVVANYGWN